MLSEHVRESRWSLMSLDSVVALNCVEISKEMVCARLFRKAPVDYTEINLESLVGAVHSTEPKNKWLVSDFPRNPGGKKKVAKISQAEQLQPPW